MNQSGLGFWIFVCLFVCFPEESGIPPPRLALPVGLALEAAREKLAPEEPPEKRAVLMGTMDPPRLGAPPSFLPRGKAPLRGEEGLVSEGLWASVLREGRLFTRWTLEVVQTDPFIDSHVIMVWGSSAGIRRESKCEIQFPKM